MKLPRCLLFLSCSVLSGCTTVDPPSRAERQAYLREFTVLQIEKKIAEMVHTSRDWESCDERIYKRQDIDGDGIRDVILLTTFEHGNGWWQELFVCLSSAPHKVMHVDLGGRNERRADELDVNELKITIKGRKIVDGDAMCCPSQPYESVFVVVDGKIVQRQ